jgi:hypothetical protein
MNWWMLAGGLSALLCTAGHAFAGVGIFYRPDQGGHRQSLASRRIYRNVASHHDQFRGCRRSRSLSSASMGEEEKQHGWRHNSPVTPSSTWLYRCVLAEFQWMPFGITAILAAIGAQMAH